MGHLLSSGFEVQEQRVRDVASIHARYGVPESLRSCHVGLVEDDVVVGHVPATAVRRLLDERPDVAGIAVPDMPAGAPGMETPGRPSVPYRVLVFDRMGRVVDSWSP